jgi:hypothetical protein
MGVDYDVEWDPKALKELRKLDGVMMIPDGLEQAASGEHALTQTE